ncbi:MAG: M50 family metallopeptidase, partial [Limisphaerales bacterium]
SLARGIFPASVEGLPPATYWWMGVAGALGLFLSIVLHEFGHSVVARRFGIPMNGITLFIFGGVAEMGDEPPSPKSELLMAIAGPITSVVLGGIAYGLRRLSDAWAWPIESTVILAYLSWINFALAAFNLIPAFPLDGGRVLRSILWGVRGNVVSATRIASAIGTGFAFLLIFWGIVSFVFGNFIMGVWWVILGLFIQRVSRASYDRIRVREVLQGETVRHFMHRDLITVPPSISVKELVDNYVYRYYFKTFPVVDHDRLMGCVDLTRLKEVPRQEWEHRTAETVASPCSSENTIAPDAAATKALSAMSRNQLGRLLVVDHERLVGIITLKDLLGFLSRKMELEKA